MKTTLLSALILLSTVAFSQTSKKTNSLKAQLLGKWGGPKKSQMGWNITDDSICFYKPNWECYSYKIINDDFVIYVPHQPPIKWMNVRVLKNKMYYEADELVDTITIVAYRK